MLDELQIQKLYAEIAPKLTNYLLANGLDYSVSCDIVQETFIRLWKKRASYSEQDSLSGLVFAIARNLRIDYFRRNKNLVFEEKIADEDLGLSDPAAKKSADDLNYLRSRIKQALTQISPELAQSYTLFQIGQRSIREIAGLTGASESLVKVRIHRAKEKLKLLLIDLQKEKEF